jgi:hypothetical protein
MRVIKSRKMRWGGHVAHIGKKKGIQNCSWKTSREETILETQT